MGRIRLVPVTIFVAVLMLTVKIGNIWTELRGDGDAISIRTAAAQKAPEAGKAEEGGAGTSKAEAPTAGQPAKAEGAAAAGQAPESAEKQEAPDVSRMSYSEIRLLQELAERRDLLEKRERELDQRSALLKAAEQRLVERQEEFKKIRVEIKELLDIKEKEESERLNRLVGIYSNMKPKDAATIFNELDMGVLLDVMQAMNARKVAPIIASMNAERARQLTQQLAERRDAPPVPN